MSKSPAAHLQAYVRPPLPPRPAQAHSFPLGDRRHPVPGLGSLALRQLAVATDLGVIDRWMHDPEVAEWWGLDHGRKAVGAYLLHQHLSVHSCGWVAELDGTPFAYVETYLPSEDPLARHYDAHPGDRGFHVLVGDPARRGSPVTGVLGAAIVDGLLADDGATRVLCEPDVRNTRMLAWCAQLGGRQLAELALPDKRAALIVWTREDRP